MPIYVLAAFKTHAFKLLSTTRQLDMKIYWMQKFLGMPFGKAPYLFYPRVYCVTDVLNAVGQQYEQNDQKSAWGHFTDEGCQTLVKPPVLEARQEVFGQA